MLALPLLLAACQPADAPVSAGDGAVAGPDLTGEYRVASVNGASIDQPEGVTATVTASRIDVRSGCIRFAFDYRMEGGALTTMDAPVASCRRGLTPAEQSVREAFAAATGVARTPANGVQFTGGERSVTLFTQ